LRTSSRSRPHHIKYIRCRWTTQVFQAASVQKHHGRSRGSLQKGAQERLSLRRSSDETECAHGPQATIRKSNEPSTARYKAITCEAVSALSCRCFSDDADRRGEASTTSHQCKEPHTAGQKAATTSAPVSVTGLTESHPHHRDLRQCTTPIIQRSSRLLAVFSVACSAEKRNESALLSRRARARSARVATDDPPNRHRRTFSMAPTLSPFILHN